MAENEELRARNLDDLKHGGYDDGRGVSLGPSGPVQAELVAELNERVSILMDENALLVEQKIVLGSELDKQQALLEKQAIDLGALAQRVSELGKDAAALTARAQQAESDRDEAARHALTCSDALGKAEQEIDSLTEQIAVMKQKHKEVDSAYQDLKKQLKSLSVKLDEDGHSGLQRVKQAEDRVRELHSLLQAKTQELDAASEVVRKLKAEYQSTRQDAEGMLQVMSGMERQLNEYAAREDQIAKLGVESREKIEEALTIKEQVHPPPTGPNYVFKNEKKTALASLFSARCERSRAAGRSSVF